MTDECYELKNIEFKTMIMNKNKSNTVGIQVNKANTSVDLFLEDEKLFQESQLNNKPWNKLNKMIKLQKLMDYCSVLKEKHNLTPKDFNRLKKYIVSCIEKKNFQKNKDVEYDMEKMEILNIPNLYMVNNLTKPESKKFTLKQVEKKNSTLKNLPKGILNKLKKEQ